MSAPQHPTPSFPLVNADFPLPDSNFSEYLLYFWFQGLLGQHCIIIGMPVSLVFASQLPIPLSALRF
jgi:hypothetical protein